MRLLISAESHTGRVRERNEDMVLVGNIMFRNDSLRTTIELDEHGALLLAVADGMGGHLGGDAASERAVRAAAERLAALEPALSDRELSERVADWIREIHRDIAEEGMRNPELFGMGTTMVGLLAYRGGLYLLNVGDSRLYRYRGRTLTRLTRDHSLRELSGMPEIPSNILANSIGAGEDVFVDFDPVPEPAAPGDLYLLCSDGLHDMLDDGSIGELLELHGADAARPLLERALENGGADNVSLILAEVQETASRADTVQDRRDRSRPA